MNERVALQELVDCEDLKDRAESFEHTPECLAGPWQMCPQAIMEQSYRLRKPLAWANARAILKARHTAVCTECAFGHTGKLPCILDPEHPWHIRL